MKKSLLMKILGVAAVVILLSLVIATPASAKHHRPDREVPIKGTVTGEHEAVPPPGPDGWVFSSSGTGQMSPLGSVDYFLTQDSYFDPDSEDPDDPEIISEGTITFTAANGDTLRIAQEAISQIVGVPGVDLGFELEGTWTVLDGSGRFANAAGSGSMDGIGFIAPYGPAVFNFEGKISYDASDRLDEIAVEYEVVRGEPGDVVELVTVPVGADEVGMVCLITVVSDNNPSTHPNSDLIISSNGESFELRDVEATPEQTKEGSSVEGVVLGEQVKVEVRLGEDGVFSGGLVLTFECVEPEVVEPEVLAESEVVEPEVLAESGAAPAVLPKTQVQAATAAQPTFTG